MKRHLAAPVQVTCLESPDVLRACAQGRGCACGARSPSALFTPLKKAWLRRRHSMPIWTEARRLSSFHGVKVSEGHAPASGTASARVRRALFFCFCFPARAVHGSGAAAPSSDGRMRGGPHGFWLSGLGGKRAAIHNWRTRARGGVLIRGLFFFPIKCSPTAIIVLYSARARLYAAR